MFNSKNNKADFKKQRVDILQLKIKQQKSRLATQHTL